MRKFLLAIVLGLSVSLPAYAESLAIAKPDATSVASTSEVVNSDTNHTNNESTTVKTKTLVKDIESPEERGFKGVLMSVAFGLLIALLL